MQFSSQNSRFLCSRPDGPLKASRRPTLSRNFSVEDVQTEGQHHPDARSSFSNFYSKLDFMFRHESGNSNRPDAFQVSRKISAHVSVFFYHNSLLEYQIEMKLVLLES
jgi:hypothetical protein